jgi:hypothetical protein
MSCVVRVLCVGLITRTEECGVSECEREASIRRRSRPTRICWAKGGGKVGCKEISKLYEETWKNALLTILTVRSGQDFPGGIEVRYSSRDMNSALTSRKL